MKSIKIRDLQDEIEIFEDKIIITQKKGFKVSKEIPFKSISSIQFKEAGRIVNGYLQLSIIGEGGISRAIKNENSIIFTNKKRNKEFRKLREFISQQVSNKTHSDSELQNNIKLDDLEIYLNEASSKLRTSNQKRKVGFLLGMGVLFIPYIFSWITLRKGYSNVARFTCFAWMIFLLFLMSNVDDNQEISITDYQEIRDDTRTNFPNHAKETTRYYNSIKEPDTYKGMNISRNKIIRNLNKSGIAVNFKEGVKINGLENYTGSNQESVVFQLIGKEQSLKKASAIAVLGTNEQQRFKALITLIAFGHQFSDKASQWIGDGFKIFVNDPTNNKLSKKIDGKLFSLELKSNVPLIPPSVVLIVESL